MFSWFRALRTERASYPPAEAGVVLYAVGDIHGRSDCLRRTFDAIDGDAASLPQDRAPTEIYLGDFVDRGPDSKGVLDALIARAGVRNSVFLRGNHEILLESFLSGQTPFEAWRMFGGLETALSYGVDARLLKGDGLKPPDLARLIPAAHLAFLSALKPYYVSGGYCFVHAGVRPGIPLERQTIEDLAWIREDFTEARGPFDHIVVHGHTLTRKVDFGKFRINLDTGAYMTNSLSVIRIDGEGVTELSAAPA